MSYLWTFLLGGGLVTLVTYLARTGLPTYAGVLMVFPVITISSLLLAPVGAVRTISTWGLMGALSTTIFLISFIGFNCILGPESRILNLVASLIIWGIVIYLALKI